MGNVLLFFSWEILDLVRGLHLKISIFFLLTVCVCGICSGCRADANEAALILLPSNITLFTLDFSGSGLSGGDYVSLGWHEVCFSHYLLLLFTQNALSTETTAFVLCQKNDLKVVVSYLRSNPSISRIGLWGRSMGAVTR